MDRGGLKHVNDMLFMLFCSMEMEIRHHIRAKCANETESIKEAAIKGMIDNEDVTFYWSVVAVNWEQAEADALLEMLVKHWITLRGFSHAGAFVEKYKQKNKKCTQKSKGLRKTLISSTSNETSNISECDSIEPSNDTEQND